MLVTFHDKDLMSAYIDGELNPLERTWVENKLDRSGEHRKYFEAMIKQKLALAVLGSKKLFRQS